MKLSDKIVELRKQRHWSQEDLAESLGVSRQAISKWESDQSTPDLKRIVAMSQLFGVSTDSLVKNELDIQPASTEEQTPDSPPLHAEDAFSFIDLFFTQAKRVGLGVMLCILAVIPFLLAEQWHSPLAEPLSFTVGLGMVIVAVVIFLKSGFSSKPYQWIEEGHFHFGKGVKEMIREHLQEFDSSLNVSIIRGVVLSIVSVIAFGTSSFFAELLKIHENNFTALGLILLSIGVYSFVHTGIIRQGYNQLLEKEKIVEAEKFEASIEPIRSVFWLSTIAIFLAYSFLTNNWSRSWIIWPIAGLLYAILYTLLQYFHQKSED